MLGQTPFDRSKSAGTVIVDGRYLAGRIERAA
jgi:hypothetical protein